MTAPVWTRHYDPSVPTTLALYPERTLVDYIEDEARERPSHVAIWFKGRTISMRELVRASESGVVQALAITGNSTLILVPNSRDIVDPLKTLQRMRPNTVARHPAVAEVGARGFVDAALGEISVAFVVLRDGTRLTAEEIREFCKANLAFCKVPSKVVFRSELPKSLIRKVLRRLLTLDQPDAAA